MDNAELFGRFSAVLVIISIIPYATRAYQRKITPNLTSWSLWTAIGFAILLTYRSSGARSNVWPAIFTFTNPLIVTVIIILKRNGEWRKPTYTEHVCRACGLCALIAWVFALEQQELAQYALYLSIVAHTFACVPTIIFVWKNPQQERPIPWMIFAFAQFLALFSVTEHTIANYILPTYMIIGTSNIAIPLVRHRWKQRDHFMEWI